LPYNAFFNFCLTDIPNIQPIADLSVTQENNATFTCIVDSEPAPTIQWFFNGTGPITNDQNYYINSSTETFQYHTKETSQITIFDVQRLDDVGTFTCRAVNSVGQTDEDANLLIACKYQISSSFENTRPFGLF